MFDKYKYQFPLLIKFIDAKQNLSVQLHPNDELAKKRHNSFGKTEMWYILQADKGAKLNIGFKKKTIRKKYLEYLELGKVVKLLHFEEAKEGDSFFLKPGRVYPIGGGILLAEIQQSSDITYRIYDWDRTDSKGNKRELHTNLALDALDFDEIHDYLLSYKKIKNTSSRITSCEYFTHLQKINLKMAIFLPWSMIPMTGEQVILLLYF